MHLFHSLLCLQADIKPQTDGCNGLKYNLTADVIESIFRTYPMGKPAEVQQRNCLRFCKPTIIGDDFISGFDS